MLHFKFDQTQTINEEFDFQWAPKRQGDLISKIRKSLTQNSGTNPQRKFQQSSSIRKSLKISTPIRILAGFKAPREGSQISKI